MIDEMFPHLKSLNGHLTQLVTWAKELQAVGVDKVFSKLGDEVFPPELRKRLADNSWLISGGRSTLYQLRVLRETPDDDEDQFNENVATVVESWLPEIEKRAAKLDPKRQRLVDRGIALHKKDDWMLSIPLLLIQADGICFDKFADHSWIGSFDFYERKPGNLLKAVKGKPEEPFASVFAQNNKLTKGGKLKPLTANLPLCRHFVLHGCDTDYDSRVNSYRALGVLDFAMWLADLTQEIDSK